MTAHHQHQQVRDVLVLTLGLNVSVALGKIALGLMTGALAVTADGLHSLSDAAGNVTGLIANHYAAQPPDAEHPYGHRRFETMAALFIGGLLLLAAWEVMQGVLERLNSDMTPTITPLLLAVLLVTLVINILVSRYQTRAGRRLRSEILLADAANTRADVFVTLSVILSTLFVAAGYPWVDVVAALIVVALIGRAAWQILRQTGRVLVDTAPYTPEQLRTLVDDLPGIERVIRARSRGPLDEAHIDIDVQVAPAMTADHSATIAEAIRERLEARLGPLAEIEVHFAPHYARQPDVVLVARAKADALGLGTHGIQRIASGETTRLEMHVEVPPDQTLVQAHATVSQLEHDLRLALPDLDDVITHIEPASRPETPPDDSAIQRRIESLSTHAQNLLQEHFPEVGWHHLRAWPQTQADQDDQMALSMHAVLPPATPIESAHEVAERAETLLKGVFPQVTRVTIHTEPYDH